MNTPVPKTVPGFTAFRPVQTRSTLSATPLITDYFHPRLVVIYPARSHEPEHEKFVHAALGRRIATLLGIEFGGDYDPQVHSSSRLYFVPSDTIVGLENASKLGILSEHDLFGGVAPHAFMPTKAITHSLCETATHVPAGWSSSFGRRVKQSVLSGITAFTLEDARKGGVQLLDRGPVRVKPVQATAGRGQTRVTTLAELDAALHGLDISLLAQCGLVLEEHLDQVKTYSAGQVRLGGIVASYVGTQRLTPDNNGAMVYGGSELILTRGDFDSLFQLDLSDAYRLAIAQAKIYDDAATRCLSGFFASRRNYDIAQGIDSAGRMRSGVLEQSWRIGGASAAEIAALEVLHADPAIQAVRSSTLEIFGNDIAAPAHAVELYHGIDPDLGVIRKYVTVQAYGH